ncbi:MAG: sulfatase-like hydrolase/transferase, partial [Bryobacteraceae bacterium]
PDGVFARKVAGWLDTMSRSKKPFFLGAGFRRPHAPYAAPKKYFDLFPADKMPLPDTKPSDFDKVLPAALNHLPPDKPLTELEVRQQRAAYYACASFMDAQLGVVLDAMDRGKLWDNTAVVFMGDNGYLLGEHGGMWHKSSLFEPCPRIPLVVAAPGIRAAGRHSQRLVELVDLYPTLAQVCGLTPPANLEGYSLRPLLDDPALPWKKAVFSMQGRGKQRTEAAKEIEFLGKSVRTDRWRYTEWDEGRKGIELYDHVADPREVNSLAGNPTFDKVRTELSAMLRAGWRAALPPGAKP